METSRFCTLPIFKKGVKHNPANYHPISLTSLVCKTVEKIVKDALAKHYEKKSQKSCLTNNTAEALAGPAKKEVKDHWCILLDDGHNNWLNIYMLTTIKLWQDKNAKTKMATKYSLNFEFSKCNENYHLKHQYHFGREKPKTSGNFV